MKARGWFWLMCFSAALLAFSSSAMAQSMLEYSALQTAVAGAAAKDKDEKGQEGEDASSPGGSTLAGQATRQLYGQTAGLMTREGAVLGQVGSGIAAPGPSVPASFAAGRKAPGEAKATEPESTEIAGEPEVKVFLKDGTVVEGRLLERADKHVRIDVVGVPVTYFNEDIARIEEIAS